MTQEAVKNLKIWITTGSAIIGSLFAIYEAFTYIKDSMDETAKEKIEFWTLPVVKSEIKATLDSIYKNRKYSKSIGLRFFPDENKLKYIHTNGKEYRPFLDQQQDLYYFINEENIEEWCK